MNVTHIHALSPLDGRYVERLSPIHQYFSEYALIKYRLHTEVEYLVFLLQKTKLQPVSKSEAEKIRNIATAFDDIAALRIKEIEAGCRHDVKAVEYYLQEELKKDNLHRLIPYIHFGLTSEDINSCAYGLALTEIQHQVLLSSVSAVIETLVSISAQTAEMVMLARTHGQPAVPTTLGKELIVFATRLEKTLVALRTHKIESKLSGAVGNWNALNFVLPEEDWQKFSEEFIAHLGLVSNQVATQIVPAESYTEFFQILVRINSVLIDCSRDCWQYISDNYLIQQVKKQEVGSSTMPHKVNPIDFENSEGNAGVAIALLQHFVEKLPISRLQRDLSDSTVKRSFGTALGHTYLALESLKRGLTKVGPNEAQMKKIISEHPEVLAEALQTALRLSDVEDAYEKIKEQTRGKTSTKLDLDTAAKAITNKSLRQRFLSLTTIEYSGLAAKIVKNEVARITKKIIQQERMHEEK